MQTVFQTCPVQTLRHFYWKACAPYQASVSDCYLSLKVFLEVCISKKYSWHDLLITDIELAQLLTNCFARLEANYRRMGQNISADYYALKLMDLQELIDEADQKFHILSPCEFYDSCFANFRHN